MASPSQHLPPLDSGTSWTSNSPLPRWRFGFKAHKLTLKDIRHFRSFQDVKEWQGWCWCSDVPISHKRKHVFSALPCSSLADGRMPQHFPCQTFSNWATDGVPEQDEGCAGAVLAPGTGYICGSLVLSNLGNVSNDDWLVRMGDEGPMRMYYIYIYIHT